VVAKRETGWRLEVIVDSSGGSGRGRRTRRRRTRRGAGGEE